MYIPREGSLQDTSGTYLFPYLKWGLNLAIINFKMADFKVRFKNNRHIVKFQKFKNYGLPPYWKMAPIQDGDPNISWRQIVWD